MSSPTSTLLCTRAGLLCHVSDRLVSHGPHNATVHAQVRSNRHGRIHGQMTGACLLHPHEGEVLLSTSEPARIGFENIELIV
jgi:predicted house-cleaning NTP pyrophosphatase (Maf/HAM1 superfamily)